MTEPFEIVLAEFAVPVQLVFAKKLPPVPGSSEISVPAMEFVVISEEKLLSPGASIQFKVAG